MEQREITRYLKKAVLNFDFRKIVKNDIELSFEGFNLENSEKETLRKRSNDISDLVFLATKDILQSYYPDFAISKQNFQSTFQVRAIIVIPEPGGPDPVGPSPKPKDPTPAPTPEPKDPTPKPKDPTPAPEPKDPSPEPEPDDPDDPDSLRDMERKIKIRQIAKLLKEDDLKDGRSNLILELIQLIK